MSATKKRPYQSLTRSTKAIDTRKRILASAKNLFESEGFEQVTIEKIALASTVSIPTVYSLFQSKRGVLRALMDESLPSHQFESLVEMSLNEKSPEKRLGISARIARRLYDAEKEQMNIFRGAAVLSPELKDLEEEREKRRHTRQEVTIKAMKEEQSLKKGLSATEARDILWALTGRDLYRMLVIEQKWSSDAYEKWLAQTLISTLTED